MFRLVTGFLLLFAMGEVTAPAQNPALPTPFPCAQENGRCAFLGTGMAYFGASGVYAARTATDGADCTASVFGDPDPGLVKSCLTSMVPATACAAEGGTCTFPGRALVLYGANGVFAGRVLSGSAACSNDEFGDPTPNVVKTCWLLNVPVAPPPQPPRVTYATLEFFDSSINLSGYVAAGDGTLSLNGFEYMAVFFAISGPNSPPAYRDAIRLGDSAGTSVLAPRSDAYLTMQAGAIGGASQYRMMPLNASTGPLPDGSSFTLQAANGRMVSLSNGSFRLVSTGGSTFRIHLLTLVQIHELQAQRTASENRSAQPQLRQGQ